VSEELLKLQEYAMKNGGGRVPFKKLKVILT